MAVSGNTTSCAPCAAAAPTAASALASVPSALSSTRQSWTAATLVVPAAVMAPPALQRPGVDDEGAVATMQQDQVENVERIDRPYARDQRALAVPVQRLQGETAGVGLAAFLHELHQL